ncbi:hypothetical protein Btru_057954 [Bulinus truncatus]|nr:hypothetical protein Btru_057954 [Bulinus truncatus]
MGTSSSTHLDPTLKDLFPKCGPESDDVIHGFYRGQKLARTYAAYRPHYPVEVFDKIASYHDELLTNVRGLAVDVCCGTGNSTLPLVKLFNEVVAVDVSEDQIATLPRHIPNLTSHVCLAEDMRMIKSGTVDLVTIATGLHWVNIRKFLKEAQRVLKPGGTFAAYTWVVDKLDNEEANRFYREAFGIFKDYYTSKPIIAVEKYQSVDFPFKDLRRYDIEMREEMTIDQFTGCLQSIHATKLYYEANPGTDVLSEIGDRMRIILNPNGDGRCDVTVKMTKDYFLILGRNL